MKDQYHGGQEPWWRRWYHLKIQNWLLYYLKNYDSTLSLLQILNFTTNFLSKMYNNWIFVVVGWLPYVNKIRIHIHPYSILLKCPHGLHTAKKKTHNSQPSPLNHRQRFLPRLRYYSNTLLRTWGIWNDVQYTPS